MIFNRRSIRLTFRRFARKSKQEVEDLSHVADENINRHFFRRLSNLLAVRRFLIGWIALILLLGLAVFLQFNFMKQQSEKTVFVSGGIFNEGIVGEYTNINPIYASGSVDTSVSELVFAGLFTYDSQGQLAPDLAESISVDETETIYTVKLKNNLRWHDGEPLNSEDVVFTFNTIKEPNAESFLLPSWQDITIEAPDHKTIVFTLKDTLSPFPHSLTTGIIPEHILRDVPHDRLRSNAFNTLSPIGSGPFKFDVVEVDTVKAEEIKQQQIGLQAFDNYHKGKPRLSRYTIKTYPSQEELQSSYDNKKVQAIGGLFPTPKNILADIKNSELTVPLSAQVMVFFKTSEGVLADGEVRKALVLGADRQKVIKSVGYPLKANNSPLLSSQVGYSEDYTQITGNIGQAKKILDKAGWKLDPNKGVRMKDKKPLQFQLHSEASAEYSAVTQALQSQWKELGVNVIVKLQDSEELKATVSDHNYEALISAILTGADPDVFAYWHSSQASPHSRTRLNFSEYKSSVADESLVAGRSRSNPEIRAAKYEPFLKAWLKDNPALALYQPRYTFIVRTPFAGFNSERMVSPTDRYTEVEKWSIRQDKVL
ncbi:peptide ABC transporter substrate-binding protein [Candidatus Parcubacteria bacterium]|nr:peptide ABC transporter substrate-binding protein [Candidatus Parcubacteria bacterium]